jgi:hypothetical protein
MSRTVAVRTGLAALLAVAALGACQSRTSVGVDAGVQCAAVLEYAGHSYIGHGELLRDPATTGRTGTGTVPSCDDGNGASAARDVEVAELVELPLDRGVLVEGTLYIREDLPFPKAARAWFVSPDCATSGDFELRGDWLGVMGPHRPRFDGDLRPPYRVRMHVDEGPAEYVGTTIRIHATEATDPALGPEDVKTSLWEGGGLVAQVRCQDSAFHAVSLASTPG